MGVLLQQRGAGVAQDMDNGFGHGFSCCRKKKQENSPAGMIPLRVKTVHMSYAEWDRAGNNRYAVTDAAADYRNAPLL